MKQSLLVLIFIIYQYTFGVAANVDTVQVYSASMQKNIKTVVIRPDQSTNKPLATLYLLHGYSGNYTNWIEKVPYIKTLVDRYNYMVVCPDGGYGSWYWDSPIDKSYRYETFITQELLNFVETKYTVCKDKSGRAISGLSMGGHGALYLAIKHPDIYGAVGSTAGGVDIRPFPNNWELSKRLGEYSDNKSLWDEYTVMNMLYKIKPNTLKIFIDCGYDDFFFGINQKLHDELMYLNIPHTYMALPGKHNWDYWSQSIIYQMAFFDIYFRH